MPPVEQRRVIRQREPGFNLTDQPYRPRRTEKLTALEKPIGARRTATRVPLVDWTIGQQSGHLPTTNPMGPKSGCLEQAQHDRADKRNGQIGRQDTQPTDDRTDEGHWGTL